MSRRKQRSAFEQVSEFDRGRIVVYRDCGLSFREIGSRVGRNPATLRYAPPHWSCTGYYGMGRYRISLSHSSSTNCRYFRQPALHLRGVGARCPSLPLGLGHSHTSTG
ncbi:hypothetical protein TNCV_3715881 [Trichonephila clavipes]|nr:hypothetical protein TNCV_3715881 [Trichonephila clavipes]